MRAYTFEPKRGKKGEKRVAVHVAPSAGAKSYPSYYPWAEGTRQKGADGLVPPIPERDNDDKPIMAPVTLWWRERMAKYMAELGLRLEVGRVWSEAITDAKEEWERRIAASKKNNVKGEELVARLETYLQKIAAAFPSPEDREELAKFYSESLGLDGVYVGSDMKVAKGAAEKPVTAPVAGAPDNSDVLDDLPF